ncbi:hypothetical protein BV898_06344 [Hypsibius exemplaris]|uniref:BTB domain-containing protein n=1 Tax=Hypsibius exemplaris TaxID=2072580 RepID=A0A1W0WWK1_HYPEX|nr:hypothetical protein BV898_06344 [Hypsibius exemplaris]
MINESEVYGPTKCATPGLCSQRNKFKGHPLFGWVSFVYHRTQGEFSAEVSLRSYSKHRLGEQPQWSRPPLSRPPWAMKYAPICSDMIPLADVLDPHFKFPTANTVSLWTHVKLIQRPREARKTEKIVAKLLDDHAKFHANLTMPDFIPLSMDGRPAERFGRVFSRFFRHISRIPAPLKRSRTANSFLAVADNYELPNLKNVCGDYLVGTVTLANAADRLVLAEKRNGPPVKAAVFAFLKKGKANPFVTSGEFNKVLDYDCDLGRETALL